MSLVVPLYLFVAVVLAATCCDATDLYKILGLKRSASTKEIKSAYRRKAMDTHPDKRGKDVSAEEAAEAFRQVVFAFEILSDENSRRRYDRGENVGSSTSSSSSKPSSSSSTYQWHFQRQQWTVPLKDKLEVKQAQARVLHVVSLDQLRTIMLDDSDRLDRNLLICFFTPNLEEMVTDKLVFPYPFAGMSPQHIWWEDLLQTVSIRFHRSNDLSRYFNIPNGDEMTEPLFMFLKRGTMLGESFEYNHDSENSGKSHVFRTSSRDSFENWMWSMIEVKVEFINLHSHPIELYWIHRTKATMKEIIQPDTSSIHHSMLTHEFYARDTRVDAWPGSPGRWKLSDNSSLGRWKIGVAGENGSPPIGEDGSVTIAISHKTCIDLSGHCSFWANQNQCKQNPNFMREKCKLTCDYCSSKGSDDEL